MKNNKLRKKQTMETINISYKILDKYYNSNNIYCYLVEFDYGELKRFDIDYDVFNIRYELRIEKSYRVLGVLCDSFKMTQDFLDRDYKIVHEIKPRYFREFLNFKEKKGEIVKIPKKHNNEKLIVEFNVIFKDITGQE